MSDNKNLPPSTAPAPDARQSVNPQQSELTMRRIEQIGYSMHIQAFKNAVYRADQGTSMTRPEQDEFNKMIDFTRAIEREVLAKAAQAAQSVPTDAEIDALWRKATAGNHGDTTQAFVRWFARELIASKAAPSAKAEPTGWLYDWMHSSALGKPDEHFTSFTVDREQAFKHGHENQRLVYTAPAPAVQAEDVRNQAQWISVDDERKPEERKPVLLFVRTLTRGEDDEGRPYETEGEQVEMGEYRLNNGSPYFQCFVSPMSDNDWVTHWMPLPAAPGTSQTSEGADHE